MTHAAMAGTLRCMAPEIIQEKTNYNEKVDVYSFGGVVFAILNKGQFPKITIAEVVTGKKAEIQDNVSKFDKNLIDKFWSFNANDRLSFAEKSQMLKGNEKKAYL